MRAGTILSHCEKFLAAFGQNRGDFGFRALEAARGVGDRVSGIQNVLVMKLTLRVADGVAGIAHAETIIKNFCVLVTEQIDDLRLAPKIKRAFFFLFRMRRIWRAVRIFRRIKSTFGVSHVAQHVVKYIARHVGKKSVVGNLIRFEI
ncbi:MAG: hypothetical protein ALAOOOJD_03255 [bacterium]|nr:hypothetical protein [bacterium]